MKEQEKAFLKGRKMTHEEIKEYFKKKASQKGSFEVETERLIREIETFKVQWLEKNISRFLDSEAGRKFVEDHKEQSPNEVFEILIKESNLVNLYNYALKKKIDELRGAVQ